ncbi:MAG TPA: SGNH/GDSL hydrolase family protein, partial [Acidimicrobiales bacterium]|nr:SGNH/GDSL hydrolase family protein [Acidimicrobiales bacterium]
EEEAVLGQGVVELELSGDAERPALIYLPEGMRPLIHSISPVGGAIDPAPTQPRWLAYGDAATQGWLASSPAMSWPSVAGRKLGFDVVNMGFAGSIRGDTALAEMLADTPAEAISIAFGSNAWNRIPHTPELMAEEIRAFLALVRSGQPEVPIVVVSPTVRPDAEEKENRLGATLQDLRIAMEEAIRERMAAGDSRLFLVEGARVLEAGDLEDGVYPGDEGHKRLAAAVSKFLSPLVNELREAALARWREEGNLYPEDEAQDMLSMVVPAVGEVEALDVEAQAMVDDVLGDVVVDEPAVTGPVVSEPAVTGPTIAVEPSMPVEPDAVPAVSASASAVSASDASVPAVSASAPSAATGEAAAEQPRIRVKVPQALIEQLENEKQERQPAAGVKYQESTRYTVGPASSSYADQVYAGSVDPGSDGAGGIESHPAYAGGMEANPAQAGGHEVNPVYASDETPPAS